MNHYYHKCNKQVEVATAMKGAEQLGRCIECGTVNFEYMSTHRHEREQAIQRENRRAILKAKTARRNAWEAKQGY